MSDINKARSALAELVFAGVNITEAIRKSLISLTYTDNEEDEADDLQIKLTDDREDTWLTKWLTDTVNTAAGISAPSTAVSMDAANSGSAQYKVTANSGLNIRSGPGTNYGKVGTFAYGTLVDVQSISNGWATITYSGQTAYVSASYIAEAGGESAGLSSGSNNIGIDIQCVIVRRNWNSDGKDEVLDCGQFELDSLDASGPPSEITIKGTSLPYDSKIRQTKKRKAWEGYFLSGIVKEICLANNMSCLYESSEDPYYERVEQMDTSDISFLQTLCHRAGISLKATNNILVLFDQATYEARDSIKTIVKKDGSYIKYKLSRGSAGTNYTSCRVSYTNPDTGKLISGTAQAEEADKSSGKEGQTLEITAKVGSVGEASDLASKMLRLNNKFEKTASFTLPGNPFMVAGVTVKIKGFGMWDGKYIVKQAKHSLGSSGYTTQITLRHVLEGY